MMLASGLGMFESRRSSGVAHSRLEYSVRRLTRSGQCLGYDMTMGLSHPSQSLGWDMAECAYQVGAKVIRVL